MNVEQILTDELRIVAAGTPSPPPPDLSDLVGSAGRARRRSLTVRVGGAILVAAAVVAAIVLGTQLGRPNASPQPAEPTPSYYAPGVPYWYDGGLYIGHRRQPGSWGEVHSAGQFTVALGADQTAVILRDGVQVDKLEGPVDAVRLSPDGTKAAWIASTGSDAGVLVVRDLVLSRDLGRLPLVLKPKNDVEGLGFSLVVEDNSVTFYSINGVPWKWTPGRGTPAHTRQQPNDTTIAGFADPADFDVDMPVRLSPDHLWGGWLTDRHGQVVTVTGDTAPVRDGVTVQKPKDPGSRFTIALPAGANGVSMSWDSPTTMIVQVPIGTSSAADVLECDIVTRTCKQAETP
jgi:hypothetical protein